MSEQVFISYSRKDSDLVGSLQDSLEAAGYSVWVDTGEISAGELWRSQIVSGISGCTAFVLVLTENSAASDNVVKEVSLASDQQKRIFPVRVAGADVPGEMQYVLAGLQYTDVDPSRVGDGVACLVQGMEAAGIRPAQRADASPSATLSVTPSATGPSRRNLVLGVGLLLAVALVAFLWLQGGDGDASGGGEEPATEQPLAPLTALDPPQTLRITVSEFAALTTFRNADFRENLEEVYGVVLDVIEADRISSTDPPDVWNSSLGGLLFAAVPGEIVALVDLSIGADAVVLDTLNHPQLDSLDDLDELVAAWADGAEPGSSRKPAIAIVPGSIGMYLALSLDLDDNEFRLDDYDIRTVDSSNEALRLLDAPPEQVVIAALREPWLTRARREGHSVAISSAVGPATIVDVLVASERARTEKRAAIERLVTAYYDEVDNLRLSQGRRAARLREAGLSREEADAVGEGIAFFTSRHAAEWLTSGKLGDRISYVEEIFRRNRRRLHQIMGRDPNQPAPGRTWWDATFIETAARQSRARIDRLRRTNPHQADILDAPLKKER